MQTLLSVHSRTFGRVIRGTVERTNIAGWVGSLERSFDLQATEEADRIVIRPR
jgi:hypothetical protein